MILYKGRFEVSYVRNGPRNALDHATCRHSLLTLPWSSEYRPEPDRERRRRPPQSAKLVKKCRRTCDCICLQVVEAVAVEAGTRQDRPS